MKLHGIGASAGIGIGRAVCVREPEPGLLLRPLRRGKEAEKKRLHQRHGAASPQTHSRPLAEQHAEAEVGDA